MNDAKYIGLDVHQATISVAVLDAAGNLVMEATLETKSERVSDRTMVGIYNHTACRGQKQKRRRHKQDESPRREEPKNLATRVGLDSTANRFASSSRQRIISLDCPLNKTRLPAKRLNRLTRS